MKTFTKWLDKQDSKKNFEKQLNDIQAAVANLQKQLQELNSKEEVEEDGWPCSNPKDSEKFLGIVSRIDGFLDNSLEKITKNIDKEKFKKPEAKALSIVNGLKIYAMLSIFKNCDTAMEIVFNFPDFYHFIDCEELQIAEKSIDFKKLKDLINETTPAAHFSTDCLSSMNNIFYEMGSTVKTVETRIGKIQRKICFFTIDNVFDKNFNASKLRLYFQHDKLNRVGSIQVDKELRFELLDGEKVVHLANYFPAAPISLFTFFNSFLQRMIAKRNES